MAASTAYWSKTTRHLITRELGVFHRQIAHCYTLVEIRREYDNQIVIIFGDHLWGRTLGNSECTHSALVWLSMFNQHMFRWLYRDVQIKLASTILQSERAINSLTIPAAICCSSTLPLCCNVGLYDLCFRECNRCHEDDPTKLSIS